MFDRYKYKVKLILARQAVYDGEYDYAYELYEEMLIKTEKKKDEYYASTLCGLASLLAIQKKYEKAIEYYQRAIGIFESALKGRKLDSFCAYYFVNISGCYKYMGRFEEALKNAEHARELYEGLGAAEHLSNCYSVLMVLYGRVRDFQQFLNYLSLAMSYKKKAHKILYPNAGTSLDNNMCEILIVTENMNNLGQAFRLLFQVLEVVKPDKALCSSVVKHICQLYMRTEDYEKALPYALQSVELCEGEYGEHHVKTAEAYIQAADCYGGLASGSNAFEDAGKKALILGHKALEIYKNNSSADEGNISSACQCLCGRYIRSGEYERAVDYANQALSVIRGVRGNSDPEVLNIFQILLVCYNHQKNYQKALGYAENILEIEKERDNKNIEAMLSSYFSAGLLAMRCGQNGVSENVKEMMKLIADAPDAVLELCQEEVRQKYFRGLEHMLGYCYSAVLSEISEFDAKEIYDFTLKMHNIDAEISYAYSGLFRSEENLEIRKGWEKINELYKKKMLFAGPGGLEDEIEKEEIKLLKMMDGIRIRNPFADIHTVDVQKELQDNEIMVEYICFTWCATKPEESHFSKERYGAFAVTNKKIQFVDIGYCDKIDSTVESFVRNIETGEDFQPQLKELRRILLGAFEAWIGNARTVYIVPDSNLYKVPFELLLQKNMECPGEEVCSVVYLSSGREIMRKLPTPQGKNVFIVANPEYHIDIAGLEGAAGEYLHMENISKLPFAEVEASEVAALFEKTGSAELALGMRATKYFTEIKNEADILHISTHGFANEKQEERRGSELFLLGLPGDECLKNAEDPFLRCGLFFAGAENWRCRESLPEDYGDGILNGRDILALDLSQYKLVVLAACQTGRGGIRKGEGIKGLRRAFELAGAGFLICTLWEVDDLASALLMRKFYEELLGAEGNKPETALAKAKTFVRSVTSRQLTEIGWDKYIIAAIDKLWGEGEEEYANELQDILDNQELQPFSHPRYWAGYIIQGHGCRLS